MSDWYRCIICGVYFGDEDVENHFRCVKHIKNVIADVSGVPKYVFNCNAPSHIEYRSSEYSLLPVCSELWKDYYSFELEEKELKKSAIEEEMDEPENINNPDDIDTSSEGSDTMDTDTTDNLSESSSEDNDVTDNLPIVTSNISDVINVIEEEHLINEIEDENTNKTTNSFTADEGLETALLDIALQESLEEIELVESFNHDVATIASIDDEQEHIRTDFERAIHSSSVKKYEELEKQLAYDLTYELMYVDTYEDTDSGATNADTTSDYDSSTDSLSEHDYNSFSEDSDMEN